MNPENFALNRAFIVYWNSNHRVIKETIMWAETLWPITLPEAIKVFRPESAAGANVTFESVTGELSETVIYRF